MLQFLFSTIFWLKIFIYLYINYLIKHQKYLPCKYHQYNDKIKIIPDRIFSVNPNLYKHLRLTIAYQYITNNLILIIVLYKCE